MIKNKMRRYVRKAIKATKKAVNVPIKACENIIHTIKNDDKKKDDAIAKFNEQQRNQNIQIENKNKEIEEESKKKEENLNKLKEEENIKKIQYENKKKEDEEQSKKEKEDEEKKRNEAINDYNTMKKNFEEDELNLIKNKYLNEKNNIYIGKENYFNIKIKNEIQNIYNESNLNDSIKIKIQDLFNEKKIELKNREEIKKRILILGKSGVGKSTLINSIFNYELAETGIGGSITLNEKPVKYEFITQQNLILYDTRGIEIDPLNGIQNTIETIKTFITEQFNNNESIHCIYYCISGNRIEDIELNLIKELNDIYHNSSLNIIFVYTQCLNKEDSNEIKNLINNKIGDKFKYIPVLAKEVIIENQEISIFGIEELLKLSYEIINQNLDDILISNCKNQVKENLNNLFNDFKANNINEIIKYYFEKYNSHPNQNSINNLENYFMNEIEKIINEELNKIINEEIEKLMIKMKNNINNLINKHGSQYINIKIEDVEKEYKDKIKNIIYEEYLKKGKENIYKGICLIFKNEIQDLIINRSKEVLNQIN